MSLTMSSAKTKQARKKVKTVGPEIIKGGPIEINTRFIRSKKWYVYKLTDVRIELIECGTSLQTASRFIINFDEGKFPFPKSKVSEGAKVKGEIFADSLEEIVPTGALGFDIDNPNIHLFMCTITK